MSENPLPPSCPLPAEGGEARILLGHGAGTRLTRQLLENIFYPAFDNPIQKQGADSAILPAQTGALAFTTDAYVVNPLEFAGGNIGTLAICGTINDLAMVGALPVALSASFILEEGLPLDKLRRVVATMAEVASAAGVSIVTGDTKVVERGKGDGIFITTSGIGRCLWPTAIMPQAIAPGDCIILSGDVGRHAVAILAARQGFETRPVINSDVASLHASVQNIFDTGVLPHCMRDLTRGGLGTALLELARQSGLDCEIDENRLPLMPGVASVVEALGLDPWFLANEGRYICIVPETHANVVLAAMQKADPDVQPVLLGHFLDSRHGNVIIRNDYGAKRRLRMPLQEPLPRIC